MTVLEPYTVWRKLATLFAVLMHCERGADSGTIRTILEYYNSGNMRARDVQQVK